jgi:8-oxo-dGTP pyrophosphatase MutT (NUDIX family)
MIWKPHVTVAAIAEKANRFLIVEERVDGQLVYNQPAGHLDSGESLIEAVIRETFEETAWTFQPEALVGIQLWRHPVHSESYLRFP